MGWKAEFRAGVVAIAPIIVAAIPIGLVFGAVAVSKGLSPLEATLMSALVFAGGSQFVAMDLWTHPASWAALGLAALLVNVRHVLMGASLGTKLDRFPSHGKYLGALVMADENWAMAEARARRMPLTPAYYAGLSVLFYLNWIASTLVGALLGALLGDPAALGLDFVFTALFVALVTRFWRGAETGLVLMASGLAAIVAHKFLPGAWYIPAGALAGVLALLATDLLRRKSAP